MASSRSKLRLDKSAVSPSFGLATRIDQSKQGMRNDMKSKPHKNNNQPAQSPDIALREQIEKRAHEIWLATGCPHGDDLSHWLQAESEVLKECG
jgi:hypothetical protein